MPASSFVKSKFGKEAYRQRSYQYSKFQHFNTSQKKYEATISYLSNFYNNLILINCQIQSPSCQHCSSLILKSINNCNAAVTTSRSGKTQAINRFNIDVP